VSVAAFLLVLVVIAALAVGIPSVVAYAGGSDKRRELREARTETALYRSREKIATKALRAIANGAGNPVYEAQDALDKIDLTYETKELN
jgi:hypothetical protein